MLPRPAQYKANQPGMLGCCCSGVTGLSYVFESLCRCWLQPTYTVWLFTGAVSQLHHICSCAGSRAVQHRLYLALRPPDSSFGLQCVCVCVFVLPSFSHCMVVGASLSCAPSSPCQPPVTMSGTRWQSRSAEVISVSHTHTHTHSLMDLLLGVYICCCVCGALTSQRRDVS